MAVSQVGLMAVWAYVELADQCRWWANEAERVGRALAAYAPTMKQERAAYDHDAHALATLRRNLAAFEHSAGASLTYLHPSEIEQAARMIAHAAASMVVQLDRWEEWHLTHLPVPDPDPLLWQPEARPEPVVHRQLRRHRRPAVPLLLLAAGLCALVGGFGQFTRWCDTTGEAIPYEAQFHTVSAFALAAMGLCLLLALGFTLTVPKPKKAWFRPKDAAEWELLMLTVGCALAIIMAAPDAGNVQDGGHQAAHAQVMVGIAVLGLILTTITFGMRRLAKKHPAAAQAIGVLAAADLAHRAYIRHEEQQADRIANATIKAQQDAEFRRRMGWS